MLSLAAIAREAGIAVSTLHSKVERGTPLADDEARAIGSVLAASGITLATPRKAKGTHVQT